MEHDPRFPIGKFALAEYSSRAENIETIAKVPTELNAAVDGLSDVQLDTPYRDGGWTLRQTVHHLADSHINSLCRFKLALTEDETPTIKPYFEERWAELADNKLPVYISLAIIAGVHARWTALLKGMSNEDYTREFTHPVTGNWTLESALGLYAWHSRHHTAHITTTRKRNNW